MQTTELTSTEGTVRPSLHRPTRRPKRLWIGAVLCAAALPGALAVHGATAHGHHAAPRQTVSTVIPAGQRLDGAILQEDRLSEDPTTIGPQDSRNPADAAQADATAAVNQVPEGGSGGD